MSTSKRIRLTPGQLMVHLGLLLLVVLWILPTVGLLVSSFRDKDQLAATGWWTALSTSVQNGQGRTGTSEQMVETGGKFVIAGNLLDDSKRTILTFNTNFRDLTAYKAGEALTFKDQSQIRVEADGSYRWESEQPIEEKRGKRIFFVAESPPTFTLDNYIEVLTSEGIGQSFLNTFVVTIPATIIPITIAAFAAYAFAWMQFPGRQFLFVVVVGLLVVPLQMSLIPLLRMYNNIGALLDVSAKSYVGIWLAHTG
ncbi:MAG: carbohydrate ABC transporter permease, partial [Deltaproteobacteria bacterium]